MPRKAKSKKEKRIGKPKIDGLNADDLKKLHRAVRQVWAWSEPVRIARKRSMHADGFPRCENPECESKGGPVPKVFADHIEAVGPVGAPGYVQRMFIPSARLQMLCDKCHKKKTKEERKAAKDALELLHS